MIENPLKETNFIENFIRQEDTLGIVGFITSREDFFKLASKMVASIAKSEDKLVQHKFKSIKPYIVGTYKGKDYYSVFFVKKDTPTYEGFEQLENKAEFKIKE